MHPKRFVTSSALVETRPIRCRRIWRPTHYWLYLSRKLIQVVGGKVNITCAQFFVVLRGNVYLKN